jgi:hypothetical protein
MTRQAEKDRQQLIGVLGSVLGSADQVGYAPQCRLVQQEEAAKTSFAAAELTCVVPTDPASSAYAETTQLVVPQFVLRAHHRAGLGRPKPIVKTHGRRPAA